jgi:hypothetical protein
LHEQFSLLEKLGNSVAQLVLLLVGKLARRLSSRPQRERRPQSQKRYQQATGQEQRTPPRRSQTLVPWIGQIESAGHL